MRNILVLLVAALLSGAATVPALADLTIEMKTDQGEQTLQVTSHQLAVQTRGQDVIFRGDKQVLWIVDPAEKSYTEMTEKDAEAMAAKVNDAMAQLKEAMKNVPPEQRAMMEKMMSGKMTHLAKSERTVKPLDEKKTINGFDCSGYNVITDQGVTEVWAADPAALKIKPEDLSVFKDLAQFMKSALPGMDQFTDLAKDFEHPGKDQVPGFPVLTIGRDKDGKELYRAELIKVDHGTVPESVFDLPEGLTKKKGFGDE